MPDDAPSTPSPATARDNGVVLPGARGERRWVAVLPVRFSKSAEPFYLPRSQELASTWKHGV